MAQQPKKPATEAFYEVEGRRGDAAIHEPMLEGEHADAHAVGVATAKQLGLDAGECNALFGGVEESRLADEAGRKAHRAAIYAKHRAKHVRTSTADFDPDEGRDESGRWTSGGGSGASAGVRTFKRGDQVAVKPDAHAQYASQGINVAGKTGTVNSTLIGNTGRRHFVKFGEPIDTKGRTGATFPAEHLEPVAAPARGANESEQIRQALKTLTPPPTGKFSTLRQPKAPNALERAEAAIRQAFSKPEEVSGIEVPRGTKYVQGFHGTTQEVVPSIKKFGLVPHARSGADKWAEAHDMPTAQLFESGDRLNSVYLVSTAPVAAEFAKIAAEERKQTPAVLEVHIPVDQAKKNLVPDERASSKHNVAFARYKGTIQPKWIVREIPAAELPNVGHIQMRTQQGTVAGVNKDAAATQAVYLIAFPALPDERQAKRPAKRRGK